MIDIKDIEVRLGDSILLNKLSLQVERGQTVAISGESGSGKTTLLKTMIGWHRAQSGSINIAGHELTPSNLKAIRSLTYYLPQDINPNAEESVSVYLEYPFTMATNKNLRYSQSDALRLFEMLNLKSGLLERPLYELSGGERKRIGLARGLLLSRPVFFLDEPTSAVDSTNQSALVDHLLSLRDTTIVAITHDEQFMARADKHLILREGRLLEGVT